MTDHRVSTVGMGREILKLYDFFFFKFSMHEYFLVKSCRLARIFSLVQLDFSSGLVVISYPDPIRDLWV